MTTRATSSLSSHPVSLSIYGREAADQKLVESVAASGILVPLSIKADGSIISGHRRHIAALACGLSEVPVVVVSFDNELDERQAIIEHNRQREKTFSQRQREAEELEAIERERAKERQREAGSRGNEGGRGNKKETENPSGSVTTRVFNSGRTREKVAEAVGMKPSTFDRGRTIFQAAKKGNEQAVAAVAKLDTGRTTIHAEYKALKQSEFKAQKTEALVKARKQQTEEWGDLRECSMQSLLSSNIEPVDAIITDPPYLQEYIPLYGELAALGKRALKPGGILAVMCGQSYLPEILALMTPHLEYRWTMAYLTPGGQPANIWPRKINAFWKPVLLFGGNGSAAISDVINNAANDRDKDHHEWGQNEAGMAQLVERLTSPGQLVCDPFLGAGTTAVVCKKLARRFVGCDVDSEAVETAKARVAAMKLEEAS